MAIKIFVPRKKRTREHIIADQSVNHLEHYVIDEGHTAHRLGSDYGYDLMMSTFDEEGYIEPDAVYFQLKAAESLQAVGACYVFDLDIRDYNLWILDKDPVILVLFDASRRRAYWIAIQHYFQGDASRQPKKGAKTVRVRVPKRQIVSRRAVARIRSIKWEMRGQSAGEQP
jgi:hypothetical protein